MHIYIYIIIILYVYTLYIYSTHTYIYIHMIHTRIYIYIFIYTYIYYIENAYIFRKRTLLIYVGLCKLAGPFEPLIFHGFLIKQDKCLDDFGVPPGTPIFRKHRMCHGQTVVCFPIKEDDHPFHCVVLISFFGNPIHDDGMTLAHTLW